MIIATRRSYAVYNSIGIVFFVSKILQTLSLHNQWFSALNWQRKIFDQQVVRKLDYLNLICSCDVSRLGNRIFWNRYFTHRTGFMNLNQLSTSVHFPLNSSQNHHHILVLIFKCSISRFFLWLHYLNPIPLLLLNWWVGIILAPAFILLCKILTLDMAFILLCKILTLDMAAFSIKIFLSPLLSQTDYFRLNKNYYCSK